MSRVDAPQVQLAPELMAELGEKDGADGTPELLAVVAQPPDDLDRLDLGPRSLTVVLDRLSSPGNLAPCSARPMRSVPPEPPSPATPPTPTTRAACGPAPGRLPVPVVRVPSYRDLVDRVDAAAPRPAVVGTDETGTVDVREVDLTGPVLLVVGNETSGMSAAWRERCDVVARIPMAGTASSLNAATAALLVLYEAMQQRSAGIRP